MAAQEGAAEDEFVYLWHARIKGWVAGQTAPDNVDDYVQEVWYHLAHKRWRRLMRWEGLTAESGAGPNSLAAYLKTITRNRVADLRDADKKHIPSTMMPDDLPTRSGSLGTNPEHETERSVVLAGGEVCLGEFDERDRIMLTMWALGHADKAIARALGLDPKKSKSQRTYLIFKLRLCLKRKFPDLINND